MRGRRWAALVVLLFAGLIAPSAEAAPLVAAGEVVITADRTASVRLRLPKAVTLSPEDSWSDLSVDRNPDVVVTGRGRLVGVVLTQNRAARSNRKATNDGATVALLQYGMCTGAGCEEQGGGAQALLAFGPGLVRGADQRLVIPAGDYDAHVLVDGPPVTVRFRFRELSGRRSARATRPSPHHLLEATPDGSGQVLSGAGRYTLPGNGMLAATTLTNGTAGSYPVSGVCIERTSETGPGPSEADAAGGCASKVPAQLAADQGVGDQSQGFWGGFGGINYLGPDSPPSGRVRLWSSFDPATYAAAIQATSTPTDTGRAFLVLWLGWAA